MSITIAEAVLSSVHAQQGAQARSQSFAVWLEDGSSIEFLDADEEVIRTITTGPWVVAQLANGRYPIRPGAYTDAGTGAGTPAAAVVKDPAGVEVFRCSCSTDPDAFYRLLADLAEGVPLVAGDFAVFMPEPSVGNVAPANTQAPVISGVAMIGALLIATPGVWTGNPAPTITRQWLRAGVVVASGLTYLTSAADVGANIRYRETATNPLGSATAESNTIGPISSSELSADAVPSPIVLYQGTSFDFDNFVTGGTPPYTVSIASGALPSGVTKTGNVLTASGGATVALSSDIGFHVDDSFVAPEPGDLPTFGVTSNVGGSLLPFAFGHVFAEGAVPAGSYVDSDLADWQAIATSHWPDGSVRHAIMAGRATCTAGVVKSMTLGVSATPRAGTALTEANLAAALPAVTLAAGADVISLNSLIGTAAKHRTVCAGPIMSNWLYRKPVAGSNHLVAWFDVRFYKGGAIEIFPWIENAYLLVPGPTADTRTYVLTIAGTERFNQSINVRHHTAPVLLNNTAATFKHFSYWVGSDPQIEPRFDMAYWRSTGMVPNYGWNSPSETRMNATAGTSWYNALVTSYAPNALAGQGGLGGGSAALLGESMYNQADSLFAATGDARAWRASMVWGLSSGSWSCHYRDETTNEPMRFSDYPSIWFDNNGSTPTIPHGTGGQNASMTSTGSYTSHQPSWGYLQWLASGRWYFLEQTLFWASINYMTTPFSSRGLDQGLISSSSGAHTDRGAAWGLRTLATALSILPDDHPCRASLIYAWESNTLTYYRRVISGENEGGKWVNNLGVFPHYGTQRFSVYTIAASSGYITDASKTHWNIAGWMQMMLVSSWGFSWDLGLPQDSASKTRHQAIRDHAYKLAVGLTGVHPSGWDFHWMGPYELPVGYYAGKGLDTPYFADWNEAYDAVVADTGVSAPQDGALYKAARNPLMHGPNPDVYLGTHFGYHIAALAYAASHEHALKSAALAGWARLETGTQWAQYTAGFNSNPSCGIKPR